MATTTARVTPGTHNPSISAQTVRNRLREAGLRACRPVVRQVLTRHHRKQRHLWAQTHRHWTRQDWQQRHLWAQTHHHWTRQDWQQCPLWAQTHHHWTRQDWQQRHLWAQTHHHWTRQDWQQRHLWAQTHHRWTRQDWQQRHLWAQTHHHWTRQDWQQCPLWAQTHRHWTRQDWQQCPLWAQTHRHWTRQDWQQCPLWAQTHRRWTSQDWKKVIFTDGLRFCLTRGDGRICGYRQRNERYTEACTLERDRFGGGGSVMVWGGVSQHHRTELVVIAENLNAVRYREDILLPHVVPFLQAHPDSMTMPPAILLDLCVISCKTGMSVFFHGQRRARISIPLSTSGTCWIGG
uniref:Transposase Tc1-like domain-containing protein n=1 Tax=Oncorhynchus tshawytscha TaxID=74940 RepID=A0AAZ3P353_ONCTS